MYISIATLTFMSFTDKLFGFNLAIQFTPVSGVVGMYQMEQLLPTGPPRATCVNRANPMRYSAGEGGRSSSLLSETSSYHDEPPVRRGAGHL